MISNVWPGDKPDNQPFGCTDVIQEPWWPQAQCHWHCGVDIGLTTGTPLNAARAGRVTALSYGILGIQVTGRTETDYYVHIDGAAVGYGAQVARGQLVAHSGAKVPSGGFLTGPHLHFEVNTGALNTPVSSVDPVPVLTALFSGGSGTLGGGISSGGNMALAPHPTIAGRVDELVVGTDFAIWHLWGDVGSMTPAIESWGGNGVPGTLSAAWMPDGSVLVASVLGTTGQLYRKALKVDGSILYDWNPVHNAAGALPSGIAGLKGDKGTDGTNGTNGTDGAPGKDGVSPTTGTITTPIGVTFS